MVEHTALPLPVLQSTLFSQDLPGTSCFTVRVVIHNLFCVMVSP
jgi:hypothetical protein